MNALSCIPNYSLKIYSLLYFRLMVKEILPKVTEWSSGQIFSNAWFSWMTYHIIIVPFDLHITKYIFFYYLDPNFEIFHVFGSNRDCSRKSIHVHNGDYWWQKINDSHYFEKFAYLTLSSIQLFKPNKSLILFSFWQLQFPNCKRASQNKHSSTSCTTVFNFMCTLLDRRNNVYTGTLKHFCLLFTSN